MGYSIADSVLFVKTLFCVLPDCVVYADLEEVFLFFKKILEWLIAFWVLSSRVKVFKIVGSKVFGGRSKSIYLVGLRDQ